MKHFILSLTFVCFTVWQTQAQIKGVVPPDGIILNYETKHLLNGTNDGKIKTIELPQIDEGFDKNPYSEDFTKYLYAVGILKIPNSGWKANMLGLLYIENGMIYFYTLITPEGVHRVCFGVRLLREVNGTNENCDYDVSKFMNDLYTRDKDNIAESVVIKVKNVGKKPSFTATIKFNKETVVKTYTLLPAEADTNNKWITNSIKWGK